MDNMNPYTENMTSLVTLIKETFSGSTVTASAGSTATAGASTGIRVTKLTKPAKAPSWSKDMSLETYIKQITVWSEINEDVPENVKFHDIIDELKKNKDIKGLQRYVAEHILPVLVKKRDQTLNKVVGLLDTNTAGRGHRRWKKL